MTRLSLSRLVALLMTVAPVAARGQQFLGGVVRDSAGRPLPGIVVQIRAEAGGPLPRDTTERGGHRVAQIVHEPFQFLLRR